MRALRLISVVLLVLTCAARANAQGDDSVARARTHFEAGRALYQLGNYNEAVREFAAGYQLAPRPQFLLNLGQCYRKLNDLEKAREMYQRYLHEASASDPERSQAQQILDEIERQIAGSNPTPTPTPPPTLTPTPTPTPTPTTSEAAPAAAVATSATPPEQKKSFVRKNWWIFPVAAVVVGVAVGVGVYYGTRSDPCSGANLACWDLSKSP